MGTGNKYKGSGGAGNADTAADRRRTKALCAVDSMVPDLPIDGAVYKRREFIRNAANAVLSSASAGTSSEFPL